MTLAIVLLEPTQLFRGTIEECLNIAEERGGRAFVDAVEANEVPVRQYGAQVFSLWNTFHTMFLYSSLIMTELFYRVNNYPSLLVFDPALVRHTAA